ncbi:NFACT RNA binding domain-containing protein [Desulfohalovibrio reitneri]|uniref:NFACT RNA binding domain-containing protein n=1 Tax=Desulfohalovibrio reitneri TaxID=1307759 RepID=UPI0004A6B053|nr:NFACT RNA binding domain-containing protein [Desulfohalovibrio reitneri]
MEANFFRALTTELGGLLPGARLNTVIDPIPGDTLALELYLPGAGRRWLCFRHGRGENLLFLSQAKPQSRERPGGLVMLLRKHFRGRRVAGVEADWPNLRLMLDFFGDPPRRLLLDARHGAEALSGDEPPGGEPEWPNLARILDEPDIWREHPHISPPLREAFGRLDESEARDLLYRLRDGAEGTFHVPFGGGDPLPWPPRGASETYASALEAARAAYEPLFFSTSEEQRQRTGRAAKSSRKKTKRRLAHVDRDEARLRSMVDEQTAAEALSLVLHQWDGEKMPSELVLEHPEHGRVTVNLDPALSAAANMERLFRKAAKGRRGLEHVARRREELHEELRTPVQEQAAPRSAKQRERDAAVSPALPKRYRDLEVKAYRTSDGFLALRGRNAKANHKLLSQAASPFDYWFHAKDVPGAHVVLRRDHPSQEVPRRSMEEAAALAGLASGLAPDGVGDVQCAQVREVRKIKGAPHGLVRVDKVEEVFRVSLDPGLEAALILGGSGQPDST